MLQIASETKGTLPRVSTKLEKSLKLANKCFSSCLFSMTKEKTVPCQKTKIINDQLKVIAFVLQCGNFDFPIWTQIDTG